MENNLKKKKLIFFLSFYNSLPITSGASNISTNFYKLCPYEKKIFLINHEKNFKSKNIINFRPINNSPIFKFLVLFKYLFRLILEIYKRKPNVIIFEGASWIGYSFLFFNIIKILFGKIKIIYHSHNVDYEIRKEKFFLRKITFEMEKFLVKNCDIFTVVSNEDQKKIFYLYKKKVLILKNGVKIKKKKNNKVKKNIILFSGSLEFKENRVAFQSFYKTIFPLLKSKYKTFKVVITGGKHKLKEDVVQKGVLKYSEYLKLLNRTKLCIYPFRKGPGTKVKVIEALCNEIPILTTKFGFKGLNINNRNKFIYNNKKQLKKKINLFLSNNNKENFKTIFFDARKNYNIEIILNEFYSKI